MCLITVSTAARIRKEMLNNRALIESIFFYNGDGLGAMYKNKRGLRIVKILPRDLQDALEFFGSMPNDDRALAVHWRMKTHGDINLANCHPYDVVPGRLAMMHNGVLHTGNKADPTKSDTWHFIQDYLAESCAQAPGIVHTPVFKEMCGEYIDNNRFVFMDDEGKVSIVNKEQGTVHDGIWFANEYAWEPSTLIPGYKSKYASARAWAGWSRDDEDDGWDQYYRDRAAAGSKGTSGTTALTHYTGSTGVSTSTADPFIGTQFDAGQLIDEVHNADASRVAMILRDFPHRGMAALMSTHRAHITKYIQNGGGLEKQVSGKALEAVNACLGGQLHAAQYLATQSPDAVAEAICYYLDWDHIDNETEDDEDDLAQPSARYKGMSIYITQMTSGRYGYETLDPQGKVWSRDDGFATPEQARDGAIFEIKQFEGGDELPTAEASEVDVDIEAALDRQFVEALNAERDIV